jgi:predicted ATPase
MLAAVMRKPEAELKSALDRIVATGLLSRQGVPPHATYLFKHALVQVEQLTRALGLIEALPPNPDLRREQIKLQAALITPLIHIKGYSAPETKAAAEQAKALGEHPEDPLLVFSLLYSFWVANFVQFNGARVLAFADQFLTLARKQTATAPLLMAHRVTGFSLFMTGELKKGLAHQDEALAIYNPADHALLKTKFGQDARVSVLCQRSWSLWTLGHPSRALADAEEAVRYARKISHAASLMYALFHAVVPHLFSGAYSTANSLVDQLEVFASEKNAEYWKASTKKMRAWIAGQSVTSDDALSIISDGLEQWRAHDVTVWRPMLLSYQASAYADVGQFKEAWQSLDEALRLIKMTSELWCEPEVHRIFGEVVLKSPKADASSETETHFERALSVARQQQAKSWELRAAMSLARLWRDQGKVSEAARPLGSGLRLVHGRV